MTTATADVSSVVTGSLDTYPGINRFALDLVRGAASASRFLCPLNLNTLSPRGGRRDPELARALIRSNREWGNEVGPIIDEWESGASLTLIAGQQVGFGGGPLYTIAKVASLLRLRDDLARRGTPAAVFFWMATEDHDFAEVSRLVLPSREGLKEIRADEIPPGHYPVGRMPIPDSLRRQFLSATGSPEPYWLQKDLNFRDSFARLIVSAVGSGSIVLIDSMLPELRRAGRALFVQVLNRWDEFQRAVEGRSAELESLGYAPQVGRNPDGGYSFLFKITATGEREPIRASSPELLRDAEREPESFSTGALIRPLLQEVAFKPDVFVGGPAEAAYYAQTTVLHDALNIPQPQIALRGHALVAPAKVLRAIEKYDLSLDELFLPVDQLIVRQESHAIRELETISSKADAAVEEHLTRLREFIVQHDPTSARAAERSLRKIRYQLRRAGERGKRAVARRDAERHAALSRLHETLFPNGQPQDRVIGWISYWFHYGKHLIERLVQEVEPGTDRLKIIGL